MPWTPLSLAVGFIAAAVSLALFSVIDSEMSMQEIIGKISIQAVPGSIGAMFAQSEFGGDEKQQTLQNVANLIM